jgi:type IV pilus assembly protein PilF
MTMGKRTSADGRCALRWSVAALLMAGLVGLTGCVHRTTEGAPGLPSADVSRDRTTASDEPQATKRGRVRLELASAYFGRGQMATALDEVKRSIAADPTVAAAYNLRGLIYGSLGDHKLAEESFRRALQLDPQDTDAMQNFGWYLCQQSRFGEAEALFAQTLKSPRYQDTPRTLLTQGVCQARSGKLDEAERTLVRAYGLDPASPAIAVNLSEVLYRKGDLERARFYIRRVNSSADLISAQTLWLAVRIESKIGNRNAVADLGEQLRNRFPQSPEAHSLAEGRFNE